MVLFFKQLKWFTKVFKLKISLKNSIFSKKKTFLVINTDVKVILKMLFLFFSNRNIKFIEKELIWKIYSTSKVLLTNKQIQLIDYKIFIAAALDLGKEAFIIYVPYLKAEISIHLAWECQITLLLAKKATIWDKYFNFANIFSKKSVAELFKCSNNKKYVIDLELDKQPFYGPIYSPGLIELEILKIYIKTNLANSFIWLFKSSAKVFILFV